MLPVNNINRPWLPGCASHIFPERGQGAFRPHHQSSVRAPDIRGNPEGCQTVAVGHGAAVTPVLGGEGLHPGTGCQEHLRLE